MSQVQTFLASPSKMGQKISNNSTFGYGAMLTDHEIQYFVNVL